LEGLGYRIVPAATQGRFTDDSWDPDLRIVDERHIDRVPAEDYLPRTPMIILTGRAPARSSDRRVIGSVPRPATLESLYPLLQRALEDTPRQAARTPTELPGRCTFSDRRWMGAVTSLSEGGCLFRTNGPMEPEMQLNLLFPLPQGRMISTRARVIAKNGDRVGMVFEGIPTPTRETVASYVEKRLATL
jgi:hypothetical protein